MMLTIRHFFTKYSNCCYNKNNNDKISVFQWHSLRSSSVVSADFKSEWYALPSHYAEFLQQDRIIREYIIKFFETRRSLGISIGKIHISRTYGRVFISFNSFSVPTRMRLAYQTTVIDSFQKNLSGVAFLYARLLREFLQNENVESSSTSSMRCESGYLPLGWRFCALRKVRVSRFDVSDKNRRRSSLISSRMSRQFEKLPYMAQIPLSDETWVNRVQRVKLARFYGLRNSLGKMKINQTIYHPFAVPKNSSEFPYLMSWGVFDHVGGARISLTASSMKRWLFTLKTRSFRLQCPEESFFRSWYPLKDVEGSKREVKNVADKIDAHYFINIINKRESLRNWVVGRYQQITQNQGWSLFHNSVGKFCLVPCSESFRPTLSLKSFFKHWRSYAATVVSGEHNKELCCSSDKQMGLLYRYLEHLTGCQVFLNFTNVGGLRWLSRRSQEIGFDHDRFLYTMRSHLSKFRNMPFIQPLLLGFRSILLLEVPDPDLRVALISKEFRSLRRGAVPFFSFLSVFFEQLVRVHGLAFGLRGLKLVVRGKLARSQRKKKKEIKVGQIPLQRLDGRLMYAQRVCRTRRGRYGFKIWFFFERLSP